MTIRLAHAFVPRLEEFSQWGRLTVKKDKSCRQKKCADWAMLSPVHYLPLVTTALSIGFAVYLFRSWTARRSGPHLLWWAWGAVCYGLGTLLEGTITLAGNSVWLTKGWYVAGALLGGYPLAQGAVFLHAHRKTAAALGWIMTTLVAVLAVLVFLSPANLAALEATRPSGKILEWTFIRWFTPIINLYAFVWLVGGAIRSALAGSARHPLFVRGNVAIAVGGLLPGIGGSLAKAGMVEALYVLELVGLVFLWIGAEAVRRSRTTPDAVGTVQTA